MNHPARILHTFGAALAVVLGASLAERAAAQTLQLADGQVLMAQVEGEPSGDGVRVRRLDNGGALDLRWEQLSADCALRLKQAAGLAGDDQQEVLVAASEVRYVHGGVPQTVIGRIVDSGSVEKMLVQQKGVPIEILRAEVTQIRPLEVPVSQVLTPDEFYTMRLGEIAPGDQADKHVLLAEDLVRVRDYDRALEHLNRAKELANARAPERVDQLLERVKLYKAASKERAALDQIQVARVRATQRDFEVGLGLIEQFEKDFPQSKLKSEFEAEKHRFTDARTRFFSQAVAETWRRAIQTVADKKMQDGTVTLSKAREYAENQMGEDIAALVAQRLKLDVAEVKSLWSLRDKYPVGRRTESFSYGIGTWVLGEAGAIKGTKVGAAAAKSQTPEAAKDLERIARALRKMQEAARAQGNGQGPGGDHVQTEEEWWASIDRPERVGWLRAYYAEFGGALKIASAYTQPCFVCAGVGKTSQLGQGNQIVKVDCALCHGTKWWRSFKAY